MVCEINLTPTATCFNIGQPGREIFCRTWGTISECRTAALLVHGLGAHSGWFEALARRLKVRRVFTLAYDLYGFGRSTGEPFSSYTQWLDELAAVNAYLKQQVGDMPVYLVGNSMGGVVATAAVKRVEPQGLALMCPGFDGNPSTFTLPYKVDALLKAFVSPNAEIELPYSDGEIAKDEPVRQWITNDPDRRTTVPARMGLELLKLTGLAKQEARTIDYPTLMITAGIDKIVDNKMNARVFERLVCPKKARRHFAESFHDLPFDPAIEDVADALVNWMAECLPQELIAS